MATPAEEALLQKYQVYNQRKEEVQRAKRAAAAQVQRKSNFVSSLPSAYAAVLGGSGAGPGTGIPAASAPPRAARNPSPPSFALGPTPIGAGGPSSSALAAPPPTPTADDGPPGETAKERALRALRAQREAQQRGLDAEPGPAAAALPGAPLIGSSGLKLPSAARYMGMQAPMARREPSPEPAPGYVPLRRGSAAALPAPAPAGAQPPPMAPYQPPAASGFRPPAPAGFRPPPPIGFRPPPPAGFRPPPPAGGGSMPPSSKPAQQHRQLLGVKRAAPETRSHEPANGVWAWPNAGEGHGDDRAWGDDAAAALEAPLLPLPNDFPAAPSAAHWQPAVQRQRGYMCHGVLAGHCNSWVTRQTHGSLGVTQLHSQPHGCQGDSPTWESAADRIGGQPQQQEQQNSWSGSQAAGAGADSSNSRRAHQRQDIIPCYDGAADDSEEEEGCIVDELQADDWLQAQPDAPDFSGPGALAWPADDGEQAHDGLDAAAVPDPEWEGANGANGEGHMGELGEEEHSRARTPNMSPLRSPLVDGEIRSSPVRIDRPQTPSGSRSPSPPGRTLGTASRSRSPARLGSLPPPPPLPLPPPRSRSQERVWRREGSLSGSRSRSRTPPRTYSGRLRSLSRSRSRSSGDDRRQRYGGRRRSPRSRSRSTSPRPRRSRSRSRSPNGLRPRPRSPGRRKRDGRGRRGGDHGNGQQQPNNRRSRRSGAARNGGQQAGHNVACTLFVGDLPMHFSGADVKSVFEACSTEVASARVMGSQCYGFVTFNTPEAANAVLQMAQGAGIYAAGQRLNVARAQGGLPDWKKSPAVFRPRAPGQGSEGLESYEHPAARERRMAARAAAMGGYGGPHGGPGGGRPLPLPVQAYMGGGPPLRAPPMVAYMVVPQAQQPRRPMLEYDDL